MPRIGEVISKKPQTINELLIDRAQNIPKTPLLAYPATPRGRGDYAYYTAYDLDRFADEAAHKLTSLGLHPQVRVDAIFSSYI